MIADRGMCNYQNVYHLLDQNNGYIIAKSILKSTKKEQDWIYSDTDYIHESENFKYKSHIIKRTIKDNKGKKRTITEKVIAYWSRNFDERDMREHASFMSVLEKILANPRDFRITDMQLRKIRPFFRAEFLNIDNGEITESSKLRAIIDVKKVEEFKAQFGYYQIITSELHMSEKETIEKYHDLTRIEDQFRIMKSDLETRPLYVRTKEHIEAHMIICLIALTMLRMIQIKICKSGLSEKNNDATFWSMGLPANRIQKALNKWKVELLSNDLYRFTDLDDADLKLILDAFGISIPAKLFRKADLKSQIRNINVDI
jgi:transposase